MMLTILINILDSSLYKSLLLFEFLASIKASIIACCFKLLEFSKHIQEYLFRVKYFRKNYRVKSIYNTYRTKQMLKFAIETTKISIIIR